MDDFEWSPPLRRSGECLLPLISNEIYLMIIDLVDATDHICDDTHTPPTVETVNILKDEKKQMLSNLSRVCRYFCFECRPRLFRDLVLSGPAAETSGAFCQELAAGNASAASVARLLRSTTVRKWNAAQGPVIQHHETVLLSRLNALGRFDNLETVEVVELRISAQLWRALAGVVGLKELHLTRCESFQWMPEKEFIACGFKPQLVAFQLFHGYPPFSYLAPLVRAICTPSLRTLRDTSGMFAAAISDYITNLHELRIEELSAGIKRTDNSRFQKLLERLPTIRRLDYLYHHGVGPLDTRAACTVQPFALPRLESVRCTMKSAKALLVHRPVRQLSIQLTCPAEKRIIKDLKSVKNGWMAHASLQHLELDVAMSATDRMNRSWNRDESKQEQLMTGIIAVFPDVQTVKVNYPMIHWWRTTHSQWYKQFLPLPAKKDWWW